MGGFGVAFFRQTNHDFVDYVQHFDHSLGRDFSLEQKLEVIFEVGPGGFMVSRAQVTVSAQKIQVFLRLDQVALHLIGLQGEILHLVNQGHRPIELLQLNVHHNQIEDEPPLNPLFIGELLIGNHIQALGDVLDGFGVLLCLEHEHCNQFIDFD